MCLTVFVDALTSLSVFFFCEEVEVCDKKYCAKIEQT